MVENGEMESLNRTREEIKRKNLENGGHTASSWFLKGNTVRVMTCQPMPGGMLTKALNKSLNRTTAEGRTLITEYGGQPALAFLKKNDPLCPMAPCPSEPVSRQREQ